MTELVSKDRGIEHRGIGGHHHNSVALNSINTTVCTTRTIMIHSALRCREQNKPNIWPRALRYAA